MRIKNPDIKEGNNILVCRSEYPNLGASLSILRLLKGTSYKLVTSDCEYILDLFSGDVKYEVSDGSGFYAERPSPFVATSKCLHLSCNREVKIFAGSDSDIIVASTDNDEVFPVSFYEVNEKLTDENFLENRCLRLKRPFKDRSKCPQTNLFCGELIVHQGSWACYPPHKHVEPEIYFYRFDKKNGYALVEDGETVHRVEENDIVGVLDCNNHSQCIAPGFKGFIFWVQRLQNNGKDIVYMMDERYSHLS